MEMVGRQPCGSGAVAEGTQRMTTDEINQGHQLTTPPQLVPPFSSLSDLDAYHMEQMVKCSCSILSNSRPQDAPPARTTRLQQPLNTSKTEPAGENCFPHELKTRNNSDLIEERGDHCKPSDHNKRYLLHLKKTDPSNVVLEAGNLFSRRRKLEESISIVTAVPYDGKLWRKYGQKCISGAKQPRSYFRCSYWKEQGCQAKKTVQQDDRDEAKYHVVYTKHHTCNVAISHQICPNYLPIETPPELLSSNYNVKCFRSSSDDIPGKHQICPPSADQAKITTGDEQLMQEKVILPSQVAPPVLAPGMLEMTNDDEMLGFLPTLESVEWDDDFLMTMIDELFKSWIYI